MIKIAFVLLGCLLGLAVAQYGYGLGYGFLSAGGYGYPAVASVQHHQTPFDYSFGVQEKGLHSSKYHYQTGRALPFYGGYGHHGFY